MSAARVLKTVPLCGPVDASSSPFDPNLLRDPALGLVLAVNPLGNSEKACSFDCPYCDLGRTKLRLNKLKAESLLPKTDETMTWVSEALKGIHASGPAIDGICISGNGEPTLHPEFPELIKAILSARDSWVPGRPVSIRTNGSTLDNRRTVEALNLLDERIVKIDAGNERMFKAVNAPLSRTTLARVIAGSAKLKDFVAEALFIQGAVDNTSTSDVDDWIEVIAMTRPKAVHIHGLWRPAPGAGLVRCEEDVLYAIASRLDRKTRIKAFVNP